ncbi:hypothetical protein OG413_01695 [Streptomyces sp. NBC_01433]|uniref:hypothetical protein n=1 Tax=Streptomyces sp. NBC_01433 TaxID=2903864 RepID=UPI002257E91C|nr:hypothetical protein [Streptomyces sp. NBC_01433]MCX4674043.1 hypothetical protein [Streptomyces sp. NBC_01433]
MKSSGLANKGIFVRRKKNGSIHLRRKGTVIFGWLGILPLSPFMILFGLAEVEAHGFRGTGILGVTALIDVLIIRATITSRVVIDRDGVLWDVGPFIRTAIPRKEIMSVRCENNGLMIALPRHSHGIWSFSQSLIGGRSARSARRFIAAWLKEGEIPVAASGSSGKKIYVQPVDALLLAAPIVAPLLMKL